MCGPETARHRGAYESQLLLLLQTSPHPSTSPLYLSLPSITPSLFASKLLHLSAGFSHKLTPVSQSLELPPTCVVQASTPPSFKQTNRLSVAGEGRAEQLDHSNRLEFGRSRTLPASFASVSIKEANTSVLHVGKEAAMNKVQVNETDVEGQKGSWNKR